MVYAYRCYNKQGQPLGWLYTYNNGTVYTWTNKDLSYCKRWKTHKGAQKYFEQFNSHWDIVSKGGYLQIEAMPIEENKQEKIQQEEDRLIKLLNNLYPINEERLSFESQMKRMLAEMLIDLEVSNKVRYYSTLDDAEQFELVAIDKIQGTVIIANNMEFRRIDGFPQSDKDKGYLMPDNNKLCNYLIALHKLQNTDWGSFSAEQVINIASLVKSDNK